MDRSACALGCRAFDRRSLWSEARIDLRTHLAVVRLTAGPCVKSRVCVLCSVVDHGTNSMQLVKVQSGLLL
jgi:hypothetical protein